jgi:hypothetical protein
MTVIHGAPIAAAILAAIVIAHRMEPTSAPNAPTPQPGPPQPAHVAVATRNVSASGPTLAPLANPTPLANPNAAPTAIPRTASPLDALADAMQDGAAIEAIYRPVKTISDLRSANASLGIVQDKIKAIALGFSHFHDETLKSCTQSLNTNLEFLQNASRKGASVRTTLIELDHWIQAAAVPAVESAHNLSDLESIKLSYEDFKRIRSELDTSTTAIDRLANAIPTYINTYCRETILPPFRDKKS